MKLPLKVSAKNNLFADSGGYREQEPENDFDDSGRLMIRGSRRRDTVNNAMNEPCRHFPNDPEGNCDGNVESNATPAGPSPTCQFAQRAAAPVHSRPNPVGHAPFGGDGDQIPAKNRSVRNRGLRGFGSERLLRRGGAKSEVPEDQQDRKRVPW